eukprot:768269-Hanusia_phi.AAC.3
MKSLEQLRGWLTQAQEKLANAHQSLEATRKNKVEQERYLESEIHKRTSLEKEERELIKKMEAEYGPSLGSSRRTDSMYCRVERDRRERDARERELMAIDEERSRYEKTNREIQAEIEEIIRKREMIQSRIARNQQQKNKLQDDNNRLNQMLQEAEEARTNIDSARMEKENKNRNIQAELMEVEEQEFRRTKDELETKQSKFEENAMRMAQENKSLEAALQAEESLAEALRERISVLKDHLFKIEEEKSKVHIDLSGAQNRLKVQQT